MKIGFLGGSFDPVHFGHLMAAQDALEAMGLDRVVFVPAAQAALKLAAVRCGGAERLALVRAAVGRGGRFGVSDCELRRGGVSYTVDSARHFQKKFPGARLFWIIGGDQVGQLHRWQEVRALAGLVEFIVVERPGHEGAALHKPIPGLRLHRCAGHALGISSTEIRERARQGLPLECFVPRKVAALIGKLGLYR
jgi:nicotinate-nucleotide adenylyltransferase